MMPLKSRAAKQLMPHNHSPDKSGRKRTRKEPDATENQHVEDRSGTCSSKSSRHHSQSPLRKRRSVVPNSPEAEHTPAWAQKILEAHDKRKGNDFKNLVVRRQVVSDAKHFKTQSTDIEINYNALVSLPENEVPQQLPSIQT